MTDDEKLIAEYVAQAPKIAAKLHRLDTELRTALSRAEEAEKMVAVRAADASNLLVKLTEAEGAHKKDHNDWIEALFNQSVKYDARIAALLAENEQGAKELSGLKREHDALLSRLNEEEMKMKVEEAK
jgi:chromosome segregation ATPase